MGILEVGCGPSPLHVRKKIKVFEFGLVVIKVSLSSLCSLNRVRSFRLTVFVTLHNNDGVQSGCVRFLLALCVARV